MHRGEREREKKSQLPIEPLRLWHYSHTRSLLLTNLASGAQAALAPAAPSDKRMDELQALESVAKGRVWTYHMLMAHYFLEHCEQNICRQWREVFQIRLSRFAQSYVLNHARLLETIRMEFTASPVHPVRGPCRVEANLFDAKDLVLVENHNLWTSSRMDLNGVMARRL